MYAFTLGGFDSKFCIISRDNNGVDPFISNPQINANLPFGTYFPILDLVFEDTNGFPYTFVAPVSYYSIVLVYVVLIFTESGV